MSSGLPQPTRGYLRLSGPELMQAMIAIVGAQRRGNKIVMSFDGDRLVITRATVSVSVPAAGEWFDDAVIGPHLLRTVLKMKEPLPDVVDLRGEDTYLHLGFYKIRCEWVKAQ
jgi:hypothetical protein